MLDEYVVELSDEKPGQLLFVGFLGNDGLPRLAEAVDEACEGQHEGFPEHPGLRAEVTEQQVLADSGRLGDFARRRAPVVATGKQLAGGVEQKSAGFTARPAGHLRRDTCEGLLLG